MNYKELLLYLKGLTEEQLLSDVIVEDPYENVCYKAELRIVGEGHEFLEEDYPVIYLKE